MATARLTREERKSQTRDEILAAARSLFLRQGFHATSLEQIAAEAGFTKGAVFSNFASKADLFLALIDLRTPDRIREMETALRPPRATIQEQARSAAQAYMRTAHRPPEWSNVLSEFWTYAGRDRRLRRQLAQRHEKALEGITHLLQAWADRLGLELTVPARSLAQAAWSSAQGVVLEQLALGDAASDEIVEITWDALLQRYTKPRTGSTDKEAI